MTEDQLAVEIVWDDGITMRDRKALAVVAEAYLPVLSWQNIPIRRHLDEEINAVERLVLEFAEELGWITVETVQEVTDLPEEPTRIIVERLAELGVLHQEQHWYTPDPAAITETLNISALRRREDATCDVVMLPHTGDAFVFGAPMPGKKRRSRQRPQFEQIRESQRFPVPDWLYGRQPTEVLAEMAAEGRLVGLPSDVEEILDAPAMSPIGEMCPAYRVHGLVRADRLDLHAYVHDSKDADRIRIDLPGGTMLAAFWSERAAVLETAAGINAASVSLGASHPEDVEAVRTGPCAWTFRLNERAATQITAAGRDLDGGGLTLQGDESIFEITVGFEPSTPAATKVFGLDRAARLLLRRHRDLMHARIRASLDPSEVDKVLRTAEQAFGLAEGSLQRTELMRHLWTLCEYSTVYVLREDDFSYDG